MLALLHKFVRRLQSRPPPLSRSRVQATSGYCTTLLLHIQEQAIRAVAEAQVPVLGERIIAFETTPISYATCWLLTTLLVLLEMMLLIARIGLFVPFGLLEYLGAQPSWSS